MDVMYVAIKIENQSISQVTDVDDVIMIWVRLECVISNNGADVLINNKIKTFKFRQKNCLKKNSHMCKYLLLP